MTLRPRLAPLAALLVLLALSGAIALASASPAAACPPQGCHVPPDDPPPPPHPPAPAQPKYRVTILTVHPVITEDANVDQAYVKVNGITVAGPKNVSNLSWWHPNASLTVSNGVWVEPWDQDGPSWLDPDDRLGIVYPTLPGLGGTNQFWANSYGDGAHYQLEIRVERIA
jgi:opacity protein-like surface antigen